MKYIIVGYFNGKPKIGQTIYSTKAEADARKTELVFRGIKCEVKPVSAIYN